MFHELAPAGNKIRLVHSCPNTETLDLLFPGWHPFFYGSGAMSLAACLLAIKESFSVKHPEVVLPAYTCPELISSILFSGITPVLVDFVENKPWICIDSLEKKINKNTIAVIGVDFLGIPERHQQIKEVTQLSGIPYIEDSAQYFPKEMSHSAWGGDLVILSFGRGKPVSLLGGGAILVKNGDSTKYTFRTPWDERAAISDFLFRMKVHLYNLMLNPSLYWLPSSLSYLRLGETEFHRLENIEPMRGMTQCLLNANITEYQGRNISVQKSVGRIVSLCPDTSMVNLPVECGAENSALTRYPILLNNRYKAQKLFAKLSAAGLGASLLYKEILPSINNIDGLAGENETYPRALDFAKSLITLPVHQLVTESDLSNLDRIMLNLH